MSENAFTFGDPQSAQKAKKETKEASTQFYGVHLQLIQLQAKHDDL